MKKVYLICNAHIDPMWLWEWEEGAAAAVSTFRSAANLCEKYDAFIFNHNEALLYKWIEQYEPELFERIKELVKKGRWNIIGGWYLQPDCLMPSGEAFVRQILEGNNYFKQKFDFGFKTAINLDSFGHTRGLVQIMAKCGYENYLVCRPLNSDFPLENNNFYWEGFDGSKIFTRRHYELYNSPLGKAAQKIEDRIKEINEDALMILWGVGNHGGGPSEKDINDIAALTRKMSGEGVGIKHSTPDEYFDDVKAGNNNIINTSLKPCNTGCLSSMALIKQKYRELENLLFATEKIASAASAYGLIEYPQNEIREATQDLLLIQFHDILPGTSIKPVEEAGIRIAHHGIEILTRIRARCFFALAKSQESVNGGYPVLVYNYHPYKADTVIECEFQLADQNWTDTVTEMEVFDGQGKKLYSQTEKEYCNLNLDWRKRVVFECSLKPMSINRFICKPYTVQKKAVEELRQLNFSVNDLNINFDAQNGYISSVKKGGNELLKSPVILAVHEDTQDAWAMQDFQYKGLGKQEGFFKLMSKEEAIKFTHIKTALNPVRVIEDGSVRTVIEALYKYKSSFAVVKYTFYKNSESIDININTFWNEKDKALKLHIPANFEGQLKGETAYGIQILSDSGIEEDMQRWCRLCGGKNSIGIVNCGTYAVSFKDNDIMLTLQRSPAYSGHPINDRDILRQDRYTPRLDQGEREYKFKLYFDCAEEQMTKYAQTENEKPFALSFFPQGKGERKGTFISVEGGGVVLSALKMADDTKGYIARLFNGAENDNECVFVCEHFNIREKISFKPFEIKTFRISENTITENTLKETKL